jgi:hypothetical protein
MPDIDLTAAAETERETTRRTADAILTATSDALNPSPDVSGCPDTVAQLAIPAVLRAYADAEHRWPEALETDTCKPFRCACGAWWGDDGCTERVRLLAVADGIENGDG